VSKITAIRWNGLENLEAIVGEAEELCFSMPAHSPAATTVALQNGAIYTLLLKKGAPQVTPLN